MCDADTFTVDHERIPERVVHARGTGCHGYFKLLEPVPELSSAGNTPITHRPAEHMGSFRMQILEVPEVVVRRLRLWNFIVWLRLRRRDRWSA